MFKDNLDKDMIAEIISKIMSELKEDMVPKKEDIFSELGRKPKMPLIEEEEEEEVEEEEEEEDDDMEELKKLRMSK